MVAGAAYIDGAYVVVAGEYAVVAGAAIMEYEGMN